MEDRKKEEGSDDEEDQAQPEEKETAEEPAEGEMPEQPQEEPSEEKEPDQDTDSEKDLDDPQKLVSRIDKDIEELVEEGGFRSDLYYRLNVLPLTIPPLRQRPEDIPELANFFLRRFSHETKKQIRGFSDAAMEHLLSYSWPGNVRELENAVERAVVISQDEVIQPDDLILRRKDALDPSQYDEKTLKESTQLFKKNFIRNALHRHGWNHTKTAKSLGIQRTYLSRLIKELEITR